MSPETLERAALRMLVDLLLEADAAYWLKRADDFAKIGTPSCDEISQACRNKAALVREEHAEEWAVLLDAELAEVA